MRGHLPNIRKIIISSNHLNKVRLLTNIELYSVVFILTDSNFHRISCVINEAQHD